MRLAQDLNFTDEPSPNLPVAEREEYRRAFWSLFLLERLVSCGKCRQPAILDRSCSLRLPCDEIAWLSGSEQQTPTLVDFTSSSAVENDNTNSFAMMVVVASSLSHCAQYMLNIHHLGREHMPWHPQSGHATIASGVLSLETRLAIAIPIETALKEQCSPDGFLDQWSSSTLVFARLLFHLCQCLLYHPFLLSELVTMYNVQPSKTFWNHAREISFHASRDMVDLLVRAKRAGCVLVSSFSGYCVTVAATVQAIHFTTSKSIQEYKFIEGHQQCVEHLEWLSRYWSNATSMVGLPVSFSTFQLIDSVRNPASATLEAWYSNIEVLIPKRVCNPRSRPRTGSFYGVCLTTALFRRTFRILQGNDNSPSMIE